LQSTAPITSSTSTSSINIGIQKASDFIKGNINWDVSTSITFNSSAGIVSAWSVPTSNNYLYLGGLTGSVGATAVNTFYGNMQAYKEYMEVINDTVYDYHTLNPASYRGNNVTSSFYTLIRYLPLGIDSKTYDHVTDTIISSSHPSKDKPDYSATWGKNYIADATAVGFSSTGDTDNYASIVETYYVYGTSVVGLNARAEKIRLEDNKLVNTLSPASRGERSSFDTAPLDSNKLNIVFSPQEQLNRDIFNQVGYFNLNNYIANPLNEYESEYTDLKRISREYFRKYNSRPDINAYVRAFSLYDFSIFEMLKQFVPMRTNLATGLLVEPNVLERSKVALIKPPTIENPQFELTISSSTPTPSAETALYDMYLSGSAPDMNAENVGHDALISSSYLEIGVDANLTYETTITESLFPSFLENDVIGTNDYIAPLTSSTYGYEGTIYRHINLIPSTSIQIMSNSFATTASFIGTGLVSPGGAATWTWNSDFQLYYSGVSGSGETEVAGKYDANKDSAKYTRFTFSYDNGIDLIPSGSIQSYRLYVYHIDTNNWFVTSSLSLATLQGGKLVNLTGNTISNFDGDLIASGFVSATDPLANTNTITWTQSYPAKRLTWITSSISPLEYSPTGSIIDTQRSSYYWKKVIYHYSTGSVNLSKRTKRFNLAISESLGLYYSRSLDIGAYHDDEFTSLDNIYYEGSKLTAPDFNVKSLQTTDAGPVVEVYETNPNKIIRQDSPFGTELIIE
jgi:hypothetical protein